MVTKYQRKTAKVDSDAIARALHAIETGMSIRAAARDFAERTFHD